MENNIRYHAQVVSDLSKACTLHPAQVQIAKAIFIDGKKRVFAEAGRKTGKTTIIPYCGYRQCMMKSGSIVYIVAPFFKQAKELLWADRRITHFLPEEIAKKYKIELNNSEMRVSFGNGSFIKLLGSDNTEAGRGVNPDMVIFDEGKDINEEFFSGMEPNIAAKNGILMMVGTPPPTFDNLFCKLSDEIKNDPSDGAYFNFPTWVNPHISKDWLKKQKQRLIDRGEYDVWLREFEAKRVTGGCNAIFPMFSRSRHVRKYDDLLIEVKRHPKDWEYVYSFDPGSSSVFAGLGIIINKLTKKCIVIDEIYETRTVKTSTGHIFPLAVEQMGRVHPMRDKWSMVYDNAALWFANEVLNQFDETLMPCEKDVKTKNDKLSLIKDMLNYDLLVFSDKCTNTISEIESFVRDKHGEVDKSCKDHSVDNLRYGLSYCNYDITPDMTLKVINEDKRFYMMEEDRQTNTGAIEDMVDWLYE